MWSNINRGIILITIIVLSACRQNKEVLDVKSIKTKQKQLSYFELRAGLSNIDIYDFDEHQGDYIQDELRISSIGQGYSKAPKLRLELDDIVLSRVGNSDYTPDKRDKSYARWCIVTQQGRTEQANNSNKMTTLPNFGEAGRRGRTVVVEDIDGRQVVHMFFTWRNRWRFNPENTFACMLLGGDISGTEQWLQFFNQENYSDPNGRIVGITRGKLEKRHIPIMTDLIRIISPNYTLENGQRAGQTAVMEGNFRIRGSLIGLRLENKLGKDIIIKRIRVTDVLNAPLVFRGVFNWKEPIAGRDIPADVKNIPISFSPDMTEADYGVFPIYEDITSTQEGFELGQGALTEDSPVFYIWGLQDENNVGNSLKYTIDYISNDEPNIERSSSVIAIKSPEGGFKEGTAYRVTVPVE